MSFVKTFEQFKDIHIVSINEKLTSKAQLLTAPGVIPAQWRVVLRTGEKGTINPSEPVKTLVTQLSQNGDFMAWWNSPSTDADTLKMSPKTRPNTQLLPIFISETSKASNLVGQEVVKGVIEFRKYIDIDPGHSTVSGERAVSVWYDVKLAAPIAIANVIGSDATLAVWSSDPDTLNRITLHNKPLSAIDKNGKFIDKILVTPYYMYMNGKSSTTSTPVIDTTANNTSTISPTTQSTSQPTINTSTTNVSLTGLTVNQNAINPLVKQLQQGILDNYPGTTSAKLISDHGGADGKFGPNTAKAIGLLLKPNGEPVNTITKEQSVILVNQLKLKSIPSTNPPLNTTIVVNPNMQSNPIIKAIQTAIINTPGNDETILRARTKVKEQGADGIFGQDTAAALGIIFNNGDAITAITPEWMAKFIAKFPDLKNAVSAAATTATTPIVTGTKPGTPVAKPGTPVAKPVAKPGTPTTKPVTTPGGRKLIL